MSLDLAKVNRNIMGLLPHRYPMLLIDKIIEAEPGESILALKNTTFNEPFYNGHFPDYPIMPGVLILEAIAQASGLMMKLEDFVDGAQDLFVFAGAEQVRFKRQVMPGDTLYIAVRKLQRKAAFLKAEGNVFLDQQQKQLCCSSKVTLAWTKK